MIMKSRFLFPLYIIGLLFLFLMNGNSMDSKFDYSFLGIEPDKIVHFLLYVPFVPLFSLSGRQYYSNYITHNKLLYNILVAIIFSITTETLQLLNPTRSFSFYDLTANFTGVAVGTILFLVFRKIKKRHS